MDNYFGVNDLPINDKDGDLFQISPYVTALSDFIRVSPTPITIALQGGWGTGKTSFINMIIKELEPVEIVEEEIQYKKNILMGTKEVKVEKKVLSQPIITVKFNTWQYSQFNLQDSLAASFLNYMIEKLSEGNEDNAQLKDQAMEMIKFIGLLTTNIALSPYGAQISKEMFVKNSTLDAAKAIENLKKTLNQIVQKKLQQHDSKDTRMVIFIDDLDRLNPSVTITLLEVIKLFLDIEGCIFVLAVDNRVIEEGITLTKETSKDKTKSFLDKMIQVPFKIPIENYNYEKFLKDNISLFSDTYSKNKNIPRKELEDLIRYSVGSNPRAMKRLINNYILNEKVNTNIYKDEDYNFNENEQTILLSVICMQLACQPLYMTLLNSDDETILDIINKTYSITLDDNKELDYSEALQEKVLDKRFFAMYDEDIEDVKLDLPRYEIFIMLLQQVLLKIYNKSSDTETKLLAESDITKFIEIMQRAQMTSGSQSITEVKKEKVLGEPLPLSLSEFLKKAKNHQPIEAPINFKGKSYTPKEGFITILEHYVNDSNIYYLRDAEKLKDAKVSKIIYTPLVDPEKHQYSTIKIKEVELGYHFSTKESLRQLSKILTHVLNVEDIDEDITITARTILA